MAVLILTASLLILAIGGCGDDGAGAFLNDSSGASTATQRKARVIFHTGSGDVVLNADEASTPPQRAQGLMGRVSLAADAGMIFIWEGDSREGFWMKDTVIPLSVAFISSDGAIIDIQDMEPQALTVHYASEPYRYAVETNKGYFQVNGIKTGDRAEVQL